MREVQTSWSGGSGIDGARGRIPAVVCAVCVLQLGCDRNASEQPVARHELPVPAEAPAPVAARPFFEGQWRSESEGGLVQVTVTREGALTGTLIRQQQTSHVRGIWDEESQAVRFGVQGPTWFGTAVCVRQGDQFKGTLRLAPTPSKRAELDERSLLAADQNTNLDGPSVEIALHKVKSLE